MRELEDLKALLKEVEKIDVRKVWEDYSINIQPDLEKSKLTRVRSRDLRHSRYLTAA